VLINILSFIFAPNKYSILGFILLMVGFLLLPVFVGFLIMPVGAVLLVFGVHLSLFRLIPGYKKIAQNIIDSYKPYFHLWKKP